jgi:hypothetical protein
MSHVDDWLGLIDHGKYATAYIYMAPRRGEPVVGSTIIQVI